MNPQFKRWARDRISSNAVASYLNGIRTVERTYGDLEKRFNEGTFDELIRQFEYSARDERRGIPNPTEIPIARNVTKTLSNYKSHMRKYKQFLMEISAGEGYEYQEVVTDTATNDTESVAKGGMQFEFEQDLQRVLRQEIEQLEEGLEIADGGYERAVSSGRIDILARDREGYWVVIELKRDEAKRDALGQIMGYIGDISEEENTDRVRGILVASDFDKSCVSNARVNPNLTLRRYSFLFTFEDPTE